jgi:hypothetical protein
VPSHGARNRLHDEPQLPPHGQLLPQLAMLGLLPSAGRMSLSVLPVPERLPIHLVLHLRAACDQHFPPRSLPQKARTIYMLIQGSYHGCIKTRSEPAIWFLQHSTPHLFPTGQYVASVWDCTIRWQGLPLRTKCHTYTMAFSST